MNRLLRLLAPVAAALLAAPCPGQPLFSGDEIVVKYRGPSSPAGARGFASARGLRFKRALLLPNVLLVEGGKDTVDTIAALKSDPDVVYAQRNRMVPLAETIPNDQFFPNQWHLRNTGQGGGIPGADIRAAQAWDITTGSTSVIIAVVDTGVQLSHPDLASRIWVNPGETPSNGIDDDLNGFIDDVNGWNFYLRNNDLSTTNSHGTRVAGTAAAASNNAIGVAAPDWNARVMVINCFRSDGFATESDLADGVAYACDNGARLVTASWGSGAFSPLLRDMALDALEKQTLICAAAGNFNFDADAHPFYPACLPFDSVISIGGTNLADGWVYNYGLSRVDISAPAYDVYIAAYGGVYGPSRGTSFAAPLVASVAGLVRATAPAIEPWQLKFRLMGTADTPPALAERSVTSGRLNAFGAVSANDNVAPGAIPDFAVEKAAHNGVILRLTSPGDDPGVGAPAFYQVRVSTGPVTLANFNRLSATQPWIRPLGAGTTQRILINDLEENMTVHIGVRAVDEAGNPGPLATAAASLPATISYFFDPCDTPSPVWTATGFTLAGGDTHTGSLSWQESPGDVYTTGTIASLTGGPFNLSEATRPRLSYYLEHYFPSRFGELDRLEVQASGDGGATWSPLRKHRATLSPPARQVVPLDTFAGIPNVAVRFLFIADSNDFVDDGVYLDDIRIYETGDPIPESREEVVESWDFFGETTSAPLYLQSGGAGAWSPGFGKSIAPRVEGSLVSSIDAGTTGAVAQFTPFFTCSGIYEVFVTWGANATAIGVPWHVRHAAGTDTVAMNQDAASAGRWASLGMYPFRYGGDSSAGSVLLDAAGAVSGRVFSDAVRFRLVEAFGTSSRVSGGWELFD
jgi:subtilisin family serine protease